jgi:DNA-binding MarR family transcriptional regulator
VSRLFKIDHGRLRRKRDGIGSPWARPYFKVSKGRATVHSLTAKGKAAFAKGRDVWAAVLEHSFEPLKRAERDELARLLKKILRED